MKTDSWYSVEQVADQLGLHVRTVRNYVRDGRLNAVRIGKQYRIARADLDALTGRPAERVERERHVAVSSIVDIDGIDGDAASRLDALLAGLPKGSREAPRVEVIHDPERSRVKIIIVGPVETNVELLRLIAALAEDET